MRSVYLDYNATTLLDPSVGEAMRPFLQDTWGNPSSVHHIGRRARVQLDDARERCARVFSARPSEIIFTSGGTESSNLAIFGTARRLRSKGNHIITSTVEHPAVLHSFRYLERYEGFQVTWLPVDRCGRISLEQLEKSFRPETTLVSIMAANNEVGTVQPVSQIGDLCRSRGVLFHSDAVQWFGKKLFSGNADLGADLVSCCAHKIHGPKGAGLLYCRSPEFPHALLHGGGHENEHRAGTENLAGIVGLTHALEAFVHPPVFQTSLVSSLAHQLEDGIRSIPGVQLLAEGADRLPNTVSFVVEHSDSIALMAGLDLERICASSGSACSAGSLEPSHVVSAMGYDKELANALIRFSLGRETTAEEVQFTCAVLPEVIRRVQGARN